MDENEKTAPISSVGADEGQSSQTLKAIPHKTSRLESAKVV